MRRRKSTERTPWWKTVAAFAAFLASLATIGSLLISLAEKKPAMIEHIGLSIASGTATGILAVGIFFSIRRLILSTPQSRFLSMKDELKQEARKATDELELVLHGYKPPVEKRFAMKATKDVRTRITKLKIGGPGPDSPEWDDFITCLAMLAEDGSIRKARDQFPKDD